MNKRERLRQIHLYRSGQMVGIERVLFEQKLDEDPQLKTEYHMALELTEVLDDKSRFNTFRKIVDEVGDDYFNENTTKGNFNILKIAAVIALFITSSAILLLIYKPDGKDYYTENFVHRPAILSFKNDPMDFSDDALSRAMFIYDKHDYEEAIPYFLEAMEADSTNDMTLLYLGISYIGLKKFEKGEVVLKRIADTSAYMEARNQYLGFIYLSDDKPENDEEGESLTKKEGLE
jgi:tetratricopeptide (TPR) repeat protein